MLRTLLTPLRSRFELVSPTVPPPNPPDDDELAPEDFARDVLIQLMRNSVESLKLAENGSMQLQVLSEIQRIMSEDACTKDVFRELDGFLLLINVLSTTQLSNMGPVAEPEEELLERALGNARLVFAIASDAMKGHEQNTAYFRTSVGFEALAQSLSTLINDARTRPTIMGLILSLALQETTLSDVFLDLASKDDELEIHISQLATKLGRIYHPGAIEILWGALPRIPSDDHPLRFALFKTLEQLCRLSHRNQAILSTVGIMKSLLGYYYGSKNGVSAKERQTVQKLLKKLLDMGATTPEARSIFQRAVKADHCLDVEILEPIRSGIKSRWPEHFSLEAPACLSYSGWNSKALASGFSIMSWVWIEALPSEPCPILALKPSLTLFLRPDGKIELRKATVPEAWILDKSHITKSRWTHLVLVYSSNRSHLNLKLFIDGMLIDTLKLSQPISFDGSSSFEIGGVSEDSTISWCVASSYLLNLSLPDEHPRLIFHLGPRYSGSFQDPELIKFLTYEASTSLTMFVSNSSSKSAVITVEQSRLMKAVKEGLSISESSILLSLSAQSLPRSGPVTSFQVPGYGSEDGRQTQRNLSAKGDVYVVKAACLDEALWRLGGAAVALRLVQLAQSPHELSRSLGILVDGIRHSWQNSENMERTRGYEILADILRQKSHLINVTSFETLFEFLGVNFRNPDLSTVVNPIAYRAIALDLELWSKATDDIKQIYFEHFKNLLQTSRYKKFNSKQRFVKLGIVRKLLFTIQTNWYTRDDIQYLVETLKVVAQANFTKDEAIKPIVSYLAASLHEDVAGPSHAGSPSSPVSFVSRIDAAGGREKAELVLTVFVTILNTPAYYHRFAAALPHTRIPILLLGERPSSKIATEVLLMINLSLHTSTSFIRKFELINGWNVLKTVLPKAWDLRVHQVAFDILLGRGSPDSQPPAANGNHVVCPPIVPAILCALKEGLDLLSKGSHISDDQVISQNFTNETTVEVLLEELMALHTSSSTFRQIFKSQQTTQLFIDAYKSYISKVTAAPVSNLKVTSIIEKLNHLGLAFALDNSVAGSQKRQILDILQMAEATINPEEQKTTIDPSLVADFRSVRERIASARLSMQVGERTILKTVSKMQEWRKSIQNSERKRLRKDILDLRESRRQTSRLTEWSYVLSSERGLWPHCETRMWCLDETEGPQRIRKKMEPLDDKTYSSRLENCDHLREVTFPESDTSSQVHVEVPPWAESYEISATEMEDRQLAEDIVDDKHRRVRHELEPGDVIEAVSTVARVAGVDSSPGLLIIGKTHVYMLDGVVENDDGEVIDAHEAPKHLFFVPGSIVELDGPQRAQRWPHSQIASFSDKTFIFRDVALEIYFKDSRSLLVVFLHKDRRSDAFFRLSAIVGRATPESSTPGISSALLKSPLLGRVSARVMSGLRVDEISTAQRKWQAREISNFTYLSILNQISGRTPSDATQYPVFPWVLKDYNSETLDLNSPDVYRDLTKPMGALTEARRKSATSKYSNLESVGEVPFHYGTHFSSSMIVCHFLIRMAPFTNMFKTLQGGDWDLPDRLFSDLARAYDSAATDVRGDVRELIPEFYTCPEFLENSANLDFGVQQNNGERIHDVKLPPWAKQDPLLFIVLNRRALESDIVSESLPAWIDLIWGHKQRDQDALNVFHPLSYEGAVDLDSITNDLEREATVGIIHNFGQTPRKLFSAPHPPRYNHGLSTLPIGTLHGIEEDPFLLTQGNRCFRDLGQNVSVRELVPDMIGERVLPCPEGVLYFPYHPHEQIEWGPNRTTGGALRAVVDGRIVQTIEGAFCTCAAFADDSNIVTGSSDYTVRLWKVARGAQIKPGSQSLGGKERSVQISLSHVMRVHSEEVICVTASRAWSAVLSGSKDGSAVLWDLNRGTYVRSIWHGHSDEDAVHLVSINESTGYVATCSRLKLCLHTINAHPMATLDLTTLPAYSPLVPTISSMAFHEREYSYLGVLGIGTCDGSISLLTWTADGTPSGKKAQWEFLTIRTMKVRLTGKANRLPAITALKFVGESLAHGEESGKSFMWSLPD